MGTSGLNLLYVSNDYTTHDRRFLCSFAGPGCLVHYLRLQQGSVRFEQRELPEGVRSVSWTPSARSLQSPLGWVQRLSQLAMLLRSVKPDVVLAGPLQTAAAMVAALGFRPFVAMSWGSDILVDAERNAWSRKLTWFALRRSSGVFGDCQAVRNKIHAMLSYRDEQIVTFPWGIDLEDFKPGLPGLSLRKDLGWANNVVLISTRTWEPRYAIDVLVRAFGIVWKRHPHARLLLLGDGSQDKEVRGLIAELGLEPFVYVPGRIEHTRLPEYFRSADVYVSSALSDGTSISLLEAMACGLPVVVASGYGNVEWVSHGENGWLVPPGDRHALADALSEAVTDEERRRQFGKVNISVASQRADWNRNFPQLLSLLERVAVKPGHNVARHQI